MQHVVLSGGVQPRQLPTSPLACPSCSKLLQRLLLHVLGSSPSKGMEGVSLERCHALLQDRNGSHLMEVGTGGGRGIVCGLGCSCYSWRQGQKE